MTKLAIMQPYFFPYLGYWQLMSQVDRFVVYDDVQYKKGGWINRNRILIGDRPHYISVPLQGASPNCRICDLALLDNDLWRTKLLKSLELNYRRSPHFESSFALVQSIVLYPSRDLADYLLNQLQSVASALGITAQLIASSRIYGNQALRGTERVLDICKRERATVYVNAPGGRSLYQAEPFAAAGVTLRFLTPHLPAYPQRQQGFVAGLSIIDALMSMGASGLAPMLNASTLSQ